MMAVYRKLCTMEFCQPFFRQSADYYNIRHLSDPFILATFEFCMKKVIDRHVENALFMKYIPDGCVTVLFVRSAARDKIELIGSPAVAKSLIVYPDALYFGVRLKPGIILPHAGIDSREITDSEIFLPNLSPELQNLCSRIFAADSLDKRTDIISAFIKENGNDVFRKNDCVPEMLNAIYGSCGNIDICDFSQFFHYSERHLSRVFSDTLGYSPKTFTRIVRFQHVMHIIMKNRKNNICDFLDSTNYSDQSHFQREFKAFTTLTPKQFCNFVELQQTLRKTCKPLCIDCFNYNPVRTPAYQGSI